MYPSFRPRGRAKFLVATALLAGLILGAPAVEAQVLYGTIVGNVTDASHAAVPGAAVKIVNKGTSQEWNITANEVGVFSISTVPPGSYDVSISSQGFQTVTREGVIAAANNVVRVDVTLAVGAITETVRVQAEAATLQTDSADVRQEIRSDEFQNLPVPFTRNYQNLLITVPGMALPTNQHSVPANPSRSLMVNANGTNGQSANFRVDGATTGHPWLPHVSGYVPSMDAIETVNVVSNSYDAEQGYAGGAAVNVQIKSGTNEVHGSAYNYHTNQHLKARPYFLPAGRAKDKRVVNQWGGTVGGPIIKNKLFYFASFEGTFDRQASWTSTASVPTAMMRTGNFSESTRLIYDPLTGAQDGSGRAAFGNNIVPAPRIDQVAKKLADLTPLPNLGSGVANNLFASGPSVFDRKTLDSKVTWTATSKLNVNGRVGLLKWNCTDPAVLGQLGGAGIGRCTYDGQSFGHTLSMTYFGVYTLTPRFVIDANVGYTLYDSRAEPIRLGEKLGTDFLGLPGTNGPERLQGGWPAFVISGFTTLGRGNSNSPWYYHSPQSQYVANAAWIRGNHNIRFGFDSMRVNLIGNEPNSAGAQSGQFDFAGGVVGLRGVTTDAYNAYASFLLGLPSSIDKTVMWEENTARTQAVSLYLRDKWQATRKLTLSLGLRWDYFGTPHRANRGMEVYDFASNTMKFCGVGSVPSDCGVISMSKRNFAPRLGAAYRLTDSFVVRAGYGIAYDPVNIARNALHSYPVQTMYSLPGVNSYQPSSKMSGGIPAITAPNLGNGTVTLPGTVGVEIFDPHFRRAYVESWNFMLEKELGRGWIAEAGYVGNGSRHMQNRWNANYGYIGGGTPSQVLNQKWGRTATTNYFSDRFGFTSSFNALESALTRRFSAGYMAKLTYTWSKAIGPNGNTTGVDGYSDATPEYSRLNKALQSYDRTHQFTASCSAELPFGARKRWAQQGVGKVLLGGWQLNGLLVMYSGPPFTVSSASTSLNAPGNAQTADLVKPRVQILGTHDSWFDPFAFAPVTEPRFGTAGFNILRAPGLLNLDASVFREFRLGERFKLQFRSEAFNLSNTPHFAAPGTNVSSMQLNADGTIRNLNGYTVITGVQNTGREGLDERLFRFALRVIF
jgi:hypothetical protein